jgi:NAD(P)-dependent dehydrogenase (short-subunit alcohol dehydrogenase family)
LQAGDAAIRAGPRPANLGHGPARGDGVAWVSGANQGALEPQEGDDGDVLDDRRPQPLGDAEDQGAAVGTVAADLGPPTVLVNNAGVIRDNLLFKMSEQDWDTVLGVHLRGAFLTSRAAQKYMVD